MDRLFRWILAGVFLLGSPFSCVGAYEAAGELQRARSDARAVGMVVGNHESVERRDGVDEHAYQPIVTFRTADGSPQRFVDGVASLPPDFAVGSQVAVQYIASDPKSARVVTWKRIWLVPTLFFVVGLLPGCVAWVVFARLSRAA